MLHVAGVLTISVQSFKCLPRISLYLLVSVAWLRRCGFVTFRLRFDMKLLASFASNLEQVARPTVCSGQLSLTSFACLTWLIVVVVSFGCTTGPVVR